MISTGNNFGCGAIDIKDYQSEKLMVLNCKFTIDTTCEAYRQASVLEIYVPDMILPKSSNASCFVQANETTSIGTPYERIYSLGTVLTTWIKNKNTICIEKLPIYDHLGSITIVVATLYAPKGKRTALEISKKTPISFSYTYENGYEDYEVCIVEDGWCFLHFVLSDTNSDILDNDIIITVDGFPKDVSVDVFMSGLPHQADGPGSGTFLGRVENGVITIPGPFPVNFGTGYEPFFCFYAVRDKE